MLIKVKNLIFLTDLVVLDMEEERGVLLFLGRAFLRTVRAIIDVEVEKMMLRAEDESTELYLMNKIIYLPEVKNCWEIKTVDEQAEATTKKNLLYPMIDEYIEGLKLKGDVNVKLSKSERYFQRLMMVNTRKVEIEK